MRRGLACQIPRVEFLEGRVDVVGIERDQRRYPLVSVNLEYVKGLDDESLRFLVSPREARTTEGETPAAGRDGRRNDLHAKLGAHPHILEHGVPAASHTGIDDATVVFVVEVVREYLCCRRQITVDEVLPEAFRHLGRRVLQPPRLPRCLLEAGVLGV